MNTPLLRSALVALSLALVPAANAQTVLIQAPTLSSIYRTSARTIEPGAVISYALTSHRGSVELIRVLVIMEGPNGFRVQAQSDGTGPAVTANFPISAPPGEYHVIQVALEDSGTTTYNRDGTITAAPGESAFRTHSLAFAPLDFTVVAPKQSTSIGSDITADTVWTPEGSPYLLTADVAVAAGATLTIAPGARVMGGAPAGPRQIQVAGHFVVAGTASNPVELDNVSVVPTATPPEQPSTTDIGHAIIVGGSIWPETHQAVHGTVSMRDSYVTHLAADRIHLAYPVGDCTFERNVFVDSNGFSIGTGNGFAPTVTIKNNVFYRPRIVPEMPMYDTGAIVACWGNTGGTISVTGNSFLALGDGWVIKYPMLPTGIPSSANVSAPGNYWGGLSSAEAQSRILDSTKGNQYPGPVTYLPMLSAPDPATPPAPDVPAIATEPRSQLLNAGDSATLSVEAVAGPTAAYEWKVNGTTIPGATGPTLALPAFSAGDNGSYTVTITDDFGTVTSRAASVSVLTSWLTNVSVRSALQAGQDPLIVGLATNAAKPILVRAAGPALHVFGLSNLLPDPALEFHPAGATTATISNDDWESAAGATGAALGAFPFAPGSKDSAFVTSIAGQSTVVQTGPGAGVVLVEAYDTQPDTWASRLVNVSARNFVGTGDNILIAGFAVTGTGTKKLLIRGIGPALAPFGVSNALGNPLLEIYTTTQTKIAANDDWDASIADTFNDTGAFALPAGSKDAALIVNLPPGGYTAQVKGADGSTGVALVEIYEAP